MGGHGEPTGGRHTREESKALIRSGTRLRGRDVRCRFN
jgi:hypothetical protein